MNAAAKKRSPPSRQAGNLASSPRFGVDEIRFSRLPEKARFRLRFQPSGPQNGIQWFKLLANRQQNGEYLVFIDDINRQKQKESHLVQAKQDAEKASVTRSQFLANVSHEIRTPIQTIIGMMELLGDTKLDEEQTEYVRQVRFSADVMLTLVNDLLDITKAEAGQMKIENIDFVLSDTIERSVDLVSMEAHKKGLEICIDIDPGIPLWVIGDPNRLQQVILNLVKNAVKFTASGQVVVHAELRKNRGEALLPGTPEEMVHLEVIDSGIGISEQARANLFTQFYQADSSTTRKYGGTGLGLAISKTIVDLMEGRIGIESPTGGSIGSSSFLSAHKTGTGKLTGTKVRFLLVTTTSSLVHIGKNALGFKDVTLIRTGAVIRRQAGTSIRHRFHRHDHAGNGRMAACGGNQPQQRHQSGAALPMVREQHRPAKMKLLGVQRLSLQAGEAPHARRAAGTGSKSILRWWTTLRIRKIWKKFPETTMKQNQQNMRKPPRRQERPKPCSPGLPK